MVLSCYYNTSLVSKFAAHGHGCVTVCPWCSVFCSNNKEDQHNTSPYTSLFPSPAEYIMFAIRIFTSPLAAPETYSDLTPALPELPGRFYPVVDATGTFLSSVYIHSSARPVEPLLPVTTNV